MLDARRTRMATIVALESPWRKWSNPKEHALFSMRPFLEGACEFNGARLVYRSFTTEKELESLIKREAFDASNDPTLLYVSCHAMGKRLTPGSSPKAPGINISTLAKLVKGSGGRKNGLDGVWISACEAGSGLRCFVEGKNAVAFAAGYTCEIDWDAAARIDLAFINEWLDRRGMCKNFKHTRRLLQDALEAFSPAWIVGERRMNKKRTTVQLNEAFVAFGHEITPNGRSEDLTDEIRKSLGWTLSPGS